MWWSMARLTLARPDLPGCPVDDRTAGVGFFEPTGYDRVEDASRSRAGLSAAARRRGGPPFGVHAWPAIAPEPPRKARRPRAALKGAQDMKAFLGLLTALLLVGVLVGTGSAIYNQG